MPRKIAIDPAGIAGARQAKLTSRIQPLLATLADTAPDGGNWLHEVKFDGYRILAFLEGGRVRLVSRNGLDWTSRFREIADDSATRKGFATPRVAHLGDELLVDPMRAPGDDVRRQLPEGPRYGGKRLGGDDEAALREIRKSAQFRPTGRAMLRKAGLPADPRPRPMTP